MNGLLLLICGLQAVRNFKGHILNKDRFNTLARRFLLSGLTVFPRVYDNKETIQIERGIMVFGIRFAHADICYLAIISLFLKINEVSE